MRIQHIYTEKSALHAIQSRVLALVLLFSLTLSNVTMAQNKTSKQAALQPVFSPSSHAYSSLRIPAMVVSKKGTLLTFAAGRVDSGSDWADMDLVMRRSEDGGNTWEPLKVIAERKGRTPVDNPTPIVGQDGTIHLVFQRDYARAYYTQSKDDGKTWSKAKEITKAFDAFKDEYNWKVLAPGPGHSVQLRSGRLVIAVWLADSDVLSPHRSHRPSRIATIYSDDNGRTWQRGAMIPDVAGFKNPSETMAVELEDGRVMLSIRNESDVKRRGVSYSEDGISGWTAPVYTQDLFEPICMGSIIRVDRPEGSYLLFVNPDSEHIAKHPRANLTVKLSADGGKTWPVSQVLNEGMSGYSDLAIGADGTGYCLYESKGDQNEKGLSLYLKKFDVQALIDQL